MTTKASARKRRTEAFRHGLLVLFQPGFNDAKQVDVMIERARHHGRQVKPLGRTEKAKRLRSPCRSDSKSSIVSMASALDTSIPITPFHPNRSNGGCGSNVPNWLLCFTRCNLPCHTIDVRESGRRG